MRSPQGGLEPEQVTVGVGDADLLEHHVRAALDDVRETLLRAVVPHLEPHSPHQKSMLAATDSTRSSGTSAGSWFTRTYWSNAQLDHDRYYG
ncbi:MULTISPECIES: hypothetical protein [unclassified Kribbella]|uniref:hypothetical protein n=1 Tax=unclassified Kribbella TaxID=2644121 RepID=UPI003015D0E7